MTGPSLNILLDTFTEKQGTNYKGTAKDINIVTKNTVPVQYTAEQDISVIKHTEFQLTLTRCCNQAILHIIDCCSYSMSHVHQFTILGSPIVCLQQSIVQCR